MNSGLYIHIPFCHSKCIYCAFYSKVTREVRSGYVDAVLNELDVRRGELSGPVQSIYIGGGTPSFMDSADFSRLSNSLADAAGADLVEFTIEVNPEDVTKDKAVLWRECGVNRVSMGVQSLHDDELRLIGRRHDSRKAVEAFNILRRHFDNISLDLMFGLPGQTLDSLGQTVESFIRLSPEHISAYSLEYEERAAITRMRDRGRLSEIDECDSVAMFRMLGGMLGDAGYGRYEISNYSLPGRESIHNSSYWQGNPYLGLGPSAHSYDGVRTRRSNPADLDAYMLHYGSVGSQAGVFYEEEILDETELFEEYIMTRLRRTAGISTEDLKYRFGEPVLRKVLNAAAKSISSGLLALDNKFIRLTEEGVMVSDEVILSLID